MITINYKPKVYSPAFNPIMWTVESNKSTELDYRFIVDVYIASQPTRIARLKLRPNPSGIGMVDVSSIVQPYLNLKDFSHEALSRYWLKDSINYIQKVYIKVGEEYKVGGSLLQYVGTDDTTLGEPGVVGYADGYSQYVVAMPASFEPVTFKKHLYGTASGASFTTTKFGQYADYVMKGTFSFDSGTPGKFLSMKDRSNGILTFNDYPQDERVLTFINRNYEYAIQGATAAKVTSPIAAVIKFYNNAGGITVSGGYNNGYAVRNTTTFGGGPRTNCNVSTPTFDGADFYELLHLKVGTKWFNDQGIPALAEYPTYYTVQLYSYPTIGTEPTSGCSFVGVTSMTPISELVQINLKDGCAPFSSQTSTTDRVRLSWLNELGGRDYFNFDQNVEESIETESEDYMTFTIPWSTDIEKTGFDYASNRTDVWQSGGERTYKKTIKKSYTLTTDWLTQDEVKLLKTLVKSSQVWAYIGGDIAKLSVDYPLTCKVKENSYVVKNLTYTKLYTVTLTITIDENQNMQRI